MATPTDQDREAARIFLFYTWGGGAALQLVNGVGVYLDEAIAQVLADQREQMEENCGCEGFERAVRADEREAAYRAGQEIMSVKPHQPDKSVLAIGSRPVKDGPPPSERKA